MRRLTVPQLLELIDGRLKSLIVLTSSVFMKRVRDLGFKDIHVYEKYHGKLIPNLIYDLDGRFQLTSDSWRVYQTSVETIFGADIDYAQEIKDYGQMESSRERYSPSDLKAVERKAISGRPNLELASTAFIERANLTLRTKMRRTTRLASGFSKKKACR